ncbi:MAG: carboxypeptidase-like regulatory domain-containing protein [Ignavibacteria bacterium]|nr:carboxypeptidase-like regulatory domain-containing protein [Ignavibacteria bacterium]
MPDTLRSYLFHEFVWLFVCATTVFSQAVPTAILSGTVVDDSTSMVLENSDVFISETTLGSATDEHGRFEIRNVPLGSYELIASRLGYQMRSMRVVVSQSSPEQLKVALRPKSIEMSEVAVTATEPRDWKTQLEKFKKLLFGESENANEAKLLNPEVLDFTGEANPGFEATARMPLEIDNYALGYHLQFIMTRFVVSKTSPSSDWIFNDQQYFSCGGKERFTELTPSSVEERARWNVNRMQAYKGSFRHFLVSLFRSELAREGFIIWLLPQQTSGSWNPGSVESISENDILSEGMVPYEKILHFTGTLLVKYVGKPVNAQNKSLDAAVPAVHASSVRLNYESIRINSQGAVKDWSPTRLYGYWAVSRIADALPLDYKSDELASSNKDINPATPPTTSTHIIPLAIGNQWTMHISQWDTQDNLTTFKNEILEILRDTTVAGERWFIMRSFGGRFVLCMNKPDGFYELKSGKSTLRLKYPARVNDSYQRPDAYTNTKVVSVNASISVPKGTFACYQYEDSFIPLGGFRTNEYYSPGVGLVAGELARGIRNSTSGIITGKVELVDYILH